MAGMVALYLSDCDVRMVLQLQTSWNNRVISECNLHCNFFDRRRCIGPSISRYFHLSMKLKSDEFVILAVLTEGEKHGSEIMQGVYRLTNGGLIVRSSGLHTILRGLTHKGLIEPIKKQSVQTGASTSRTYYRITALGFQIVQREAEEKADGK